VPAFMQKDQKANSEYGQEDAAECHLVSLPIVDRGRLGG
jgi:hypothetical protein